MSRELLCKEEIAAGENCLPAVDGYFLRVEVSERGLALRIDSAPLVTVDLPLSSDQAAAIRDAMITGCARCGIE